MYAERNSVNAVIYKVSQVVGIERIFNDIDNEPNNNFETSHKLLWTLYERLRQKKNTKAEKLEVKDILAEHFAQSFKNFQLLPCGSTVNKLGSDDSDLDLCFAIKDETTNTYLKDMSTTYRNLELIKLRLEMLRIVDTVEFIEARVPILRTQMNFPYNDVIIDINSNNLVGVYNSHLLVHYANIDERFPAMAVVIKKYLKGLGVIDPRNGRLNSYGIILMILHFLQCALEPPILPNLIALFPQYFDGTCPIEELRIYKNLPLPTVPNNNRTLGELIYGFFNYFAQFDYENNGISIRNAKIYQRPVSDPVFSIQEPYSLEIVPINMTDIRILDEMIEDFEFARNKIMENLFDVMPKNLAEYLEKIDET